MNDPMNDPEPAPVQVIRHVGFEDLGTLAGELGRVGLAFDYLEPPRHELAVAGNAQLLIVLGGPISVNDADRFSFLQDEIELVRHRIDNRLPTLGICLGAQLIAKAMGAAVVPMAEPEIGWGRLDLTDAGKASPLRHLAGPVLHWHGETFDLPPGYESLAATPRCPNQAFAIEQHTLALQFHIEVTASAMGTGLLAIFTSLTTTASVCPGSGTRRSGLPTGPRRKGGGCSASGLRLAASTPTITPAGDRARTTSRSNRFEAPGSCN